MMRKGHESWKAKVHPAFLEIAKLWSDFQRNAPSCGSNGAAGNAQEFRAKVRRTREELLKKYPDLRPGSSSNHVLVASKRDLSEQDAAVGALEWLSWRRTGRPLAVLLTEEKAGSLEAHKDMQRVRDDSWRAMHGESIEPFKGNQNHCEIVELGFQSRLEHAIRRRVGRLLR